jgi:hypothetical protein
MSRCRFPRPNRRSPCSVPSLNHSPAADLPGTGYGLNKYDAGKESVNTR